MKTITIKAGLHYTLELSQEIYLKPMSLFKMILFSFKVKVENYLYLQMQRINELQQAIKKQNLDAYIIPSNDEFLNVYVPEHLNRLKYATEFSGSNGVAIVGLKDLIFYTDGRYLLQAAEELPKGFQILDVNIPVSCDGFKPFAGKHMGYDPMLHSKKNLEYYEKMAALYEFSLVPVPGLINIPAPASKKSILITLTEKEAGESPSSKIAKITATMHADYIIITAPDAICWLLNIRGEDVEYNPLVLGVLFLAKDGSYELFADSYKQNYQQFKEYLAGLVNAGKTLQVDPSKCTAWFYQNIPPTQLVEEKDAIEPLKAIKNATEIANIKKAHVADGKALTAFLNWLEAEINAGTKIDEITAAQKLLEFRQKDKSFLYPSFASISAYGANAAVIHYHPSAKTNNIIGKDNLYLIDSGGQYKLGTTDVTRTLCFSEATYEQKRAYTLVLKGHIAIATAKFPVGTSGAQIDALARQFLWNEGMDYNHGTGHGVGYFLSVHEGPQRISKGSSGLHPLAPGMILSNEPGYYKAGEYGIRIENLLLVKESKLKGFLEFETITLVPIQEKMILWEIMTHAEQGWVKEYNLGC